MERPQARGTRQRERISRKRKRFAMAPKVKAKAKPKAKVKAKAKAAAKVPPRRRRLGRLVAGGAAPVRRRPAGMDPGGVPVGVEPLTAWKAGESVALLDIPLEEILTKDGVVLEEATYFKRECRVGGIVVGTMAAPTGMYLKLRASGTTSEAILRLQSGQPSMHFRVHRCDPGCNGEEVSDDILHAKKVRLMKPVDSEEGWVRNLEKVAAMDQEDELADLRKRAAEGEALVGGEVPAGTLEAAKKEKEKESDKDKKKKKAKREKKRSRSSSGTGQGEVALDGSRPRAAAVKTLATLFGGTGMDPKEKIRLRVARRAKKLGIKKESKKKSSGSSTSSTKSLGLDGDPEETIFTQATRVRKISEACPGVLSAQALSQMKAALLSEVGVDFSRGAPAPVAVQYFRQVLAKKAVGPAAREMLTLASSIDALVKGKPSVALDTMIQRLKSTESAQGGVHWSIAQRLELVPPEAPALAATTEIREAQRDASSENKAKWLAGFPEGRSTLGKGYGKSKAKEDGRKGGDPKKGKGGGKNDGKKKDEASK